MEIIAVLAALLLGSAILGTLLANNRTLGRMDASLKTLAASDHDHEARLRRLERPATPN